MVLAEYKTGSSRRANLGLAVVMTGVLIAAVDTTIVVLALPEIQRSLEINLASVIWVIIGYIFVITLLVTQVGRLGDMFGRVRMYEAGFVIFIIGSFLCAISWDQASIIGFRILQGIGGALISANSSAVIADLFPVEKRGRAFGFNAVAWSAGAVLGIVLGGLIITYISWRYIFWINVPVGIVAVLISLRVLHDSAPRQSRKIDYIGMTTMGLGLYGLLWAFTKLAQTDFNANIAGYLIGGVVFLVLFVIVERSQKAPMLDLSIFKIPTMTPSLFASFLQAVANYATLFLVIMYLQGVRSLSPLEASLLLVPGYVLGSFGGPLAGRVADKLGPAIPATLGLALQVVALFFYANLGINTGLWLVVLASVINGVGGASFFPANNAAVMKASPQATFGIAAGILRMFGNVGMVFSFSVAILIASRTISRKLAFAIFVGTKSIHGSVADGFTSGLHAAFYASMAFMALAALCSAVRFKTRATIS
jgi:EmrB/QacA subfamily drug resistance transporter